MTVPRSMRSISGMVTGISLSPGRGRRRGVRCNLELHVQDNQILKVTSPLRLFLSSPRPLQARSKSCRSGFPTMAVIAGRNRPELGEYCHDRGHA